MSPLSERRLLDQVAFFDGLTSEQLATLTNLLQCKTVAQGTRIITVEEPGETAYIILKGAVKVHVEHLDGTEVILAIFGPGELIGEMSMVDSLGRSAAVVTQEDSVLLWIDRVAFWQCLRTMPTLTYNLARILSHRLRLANERIQSLATQDAYGRVARQLVAFVQQYGESTAQSDVLIPIRLTQTDIANLVGASRVRVNKVLVDYKQRNYLSVDRSFHITVHNLPALIQRASSSC